MGLAEDTIKLLKKSLTEKLVEQIVERYFVSVGWLMNPVLGFFMPIVIDFLYNEGAFAVHWVWDIVENHLELSKLIKTKNVLQAVMAAGDDHAQAEKEFDKAADGIIQHTPPIH